MRIFSYRFGFWQCSFDLGFKVALAGRNPNRCLAVVCALTVASRRVVWYAMKRNKVNLQRIGGWPFEIQRAFALLILRGDAVEQETFIIILMILVIGSIVNIKK